MDHLYFITNKFIQTYSSTKLIYLPLIVDNINIINTLFDTHLLLFNVNSSSLIGYVVIDDIIKFKEPLFNKIAIFFDTIEYELLCFVKFKQIHWFVKEYIDNDISINNNELFNNELFNNELFNIFPYNNAEKIINNDDLEKLTQLNDNHNNKKFIFVKWIPCLNLICHIEEQQIIKGKIIKEHYNNCEDCIKKFNTNKILNKIFAPFCFIKCYEEPIIANNLINSYENNLPFNELKDFIQNDISNIIYINKCNNHFDHAMFIIP